MDVSGWWQVSLCGLFGGAVNELVHWYRIRTDVSFPEYAKHVKYWLITILMIISGGVLSLMYGTDKVNALMAANIGISAPLIIQSMSKAIRKESSTNGIQIASNQNNNIDGRNSLNILASNIEQKTKPNVLKFLSM